MGDVLEQIGDLGLVPVIKIDKAQDAGPLGRALIDGGLPVAEVTFRTAAAEESIKILTKELPGLLVGAGTVLSTDQAERAVNAGARFVVSPGFNPKVVDWCIANEVPVTPGINSPTQLEMALERGLKTVKFFPAEASGGLAMLKAMAAPYAGVRFIPTGGINQTNLSTYLAYDRILACGGSWMVKGDLIAAGEFGEIVKLVRQAVAAVHGFEVVRVGIEADSIEGANEVGQRIARLFLWPLAEGADSLFAGDAIQIAKGRSSEGGVRVTIASTSLKRAVSYLKGHGVDVSADTTSGHGDKAMSIDLKVPGVSFTLVQR
jgi:2-dehydro-3-deoxyphosphogluconate aldolase/(4S)-4-hydroxy-2-oxoglutarate aldolase